MNFLPLIWSASNFLSKAVNSSSAMILDSETSCLIPVKDHTASHSLLLTESMALAVCFSTLPTPLHCPKTKFKNK